MIYLLLLSAEFPFITYYVINTSQTNPVVFYNNLRTVSLTKFDPRATRYSAAHTLDLYTEVASICRPPVHEIGMSFQKSHTPSTGYMVSVYKVFEGDDREKFERNWLYWTGKIHNFKIKKMCRLYLFQVMFASEIPISKFPDRFLIFRKMLCEFFDRKYFTKIVNVFQILRNFPISVE